MYCGQTTPESNINSSRRHQSYMRLIEDLHLRPAKTSQSVKSSTAIDVEFSFDRILHHHRIFSNLGNEANEGEIFSREQRGE